MDDRVCGAGHHDVQGQLHGRPHSYPTDSRTSTNDTEGPLRGTSVVQIPKTVRISKAEPRLIRGVWLGTIESSDEHLVGTARGVIKCRSITALPDTQRFSSEALDSMRGVPWRPSSQHVGPKVRSHIPEDDEEYRLAADGDDEIKMHDEEDERWTTRSRR